MNKKLKDVVEKVNYKISIAKEKGLDVLFLDICEKFVKDYDVFTLTNDKEEAKKLFFPSVTNFNRKKIGDGKLPKGIEDIEDYVSFKNYDFLITFNIENVEYKIETDSSTRHGLLFLDGKLVFEVSRDSGSGNTIEAFANELWVFNFEKIAYDYGIEKENAKKGWEENQIINLRKRFNL